MCNFFVLCYLIPIFIVIKKKGGVGVPLSALPSSLPETGIDPLIFIVHAMGEMICKPPAVAEYNQYRRSIQRYVAGRSLMDAQKHPLRRRRERYRSAGNFRIAGNSPSATNGSVIPNAVRDPRLFFASQPMQP